MTSAELVWRNAKTNFNGKVVKGMNEKFLEVGDVMQILGISRSAAYKLMRQINSELEKKHTLEKFASNENVEKLSNYMFQHWIKPPIFEESKEFFEISPLPIYIVSNIDTNDVLKAIDFHQLSPAGIFTSEDAKAYKPRKEIFELALMSTGYRIWDA